MSKVMKRGRACLCKDGNRYAAECCDEDSVYTQGIGRDRKPKETPVAEPQATECDLLISNTDLYSFAIIQETGCTLILLQETGEAVRICCPEDFTESVIVLPPSPK